MGWDKKEYTFTPNCKIRITKELDGVWAQYQPKVGKVYDANYRASNKRTAECAVIDVRGKWICVRTGEFEIVVA